MTILETLQSNHDWLRGLYLEHLDSVRFIQRTFLSEILPDIKDELGLDAEAEQQIREWIDDSASIFRVLKKHNFVKAFALDSLQESVQWRMTMLKNIRNHHDGSAFLHHLPHVRDPLGSPIVVFRLGAPSLTVSGFKETTLQTLEDIRLRLVKVNREMHSGGLVSPLLQYVMLLDVAGLNMPYQELREITSWYMSELLPQFPGMLAAVFVVNFSWTYSGVWSVIKHALPASALSRVFFPSAEELLDYFSPTSLPSDLGGSLPLIAQLEEVSSTSTSAHPDHAEPSGCGGSPPVFLKPTSTLSLSASANVPVSCALSQTSALNPFYGYPVALTSTAGTPALALQHGRRRKRDLALTLARLFWARWRLQLSASTLLLLAAALTGRARMRRWRLALAALCAQLARWIVRADIGRLAGSTR